MIKHLYDNPIVSAVIAAVAVAILAWLWKYLAARRESHKIYMFLKDSQRAGEYTFRSAEAISSSTGIPEERVPELCSRHPKIKRNGKKKKSWQIVE